MTQLVKVEVKREGRVEPADRRRGTTMRRGSLSLSFSLYKQYIYIYIYISNSITQLVKVEVKREGRVAIHHGNRSSSSSSPINRQKHRDMLWNGDSRHRGSCTPAA